MYLNLTTFVFKYDDGTDVFRVRSSSASLGRRPVKLFALSEFGVQRPVTSFVRPLDSGRLLESAAQAAHFVSLLRWERAMPVGGTDVRQSINSK